MTAHCLALIPVNRFDQAKGRLAEVLAPGERRELARITFRTVLDAVRGAGATPVVLTADPEVPGVAGAGTRVLDEVPSARGLNAQLESAIDRLGKERAAPGGARLLILHADLPLASAEAVRRLLASAGAPPSALAVQSGDGGTNAMLLCPPGHFPLAYGPDSYAKHALAAERSGVSFSEVLSAELSLDLDTPDDVRTLLATLPGRDSPAGRYLLGRGVEDRLPARPS
ncbi:MAG: 2-phospho-L-lactate guanylyltransferase [Dehalococcoidia bacterium]